MLETRPARPAPITAIFRVLGCVGADDDIEMKIEEPPYWVWIEMSVIG